MGSASIGRYPSIIISWIFYCKDLQLAIEVDGSIHFKEGQQEIDAIRQKRLESLGVKIIRFSDLDVKNNLNWALLEIKEAIENLKKPVSKLLKTHP